MARERLRGKWAGLTAVKISKLMGCSYPTAKRLLQGMQKICQCPLTDEHIGKLITYYRTTKENEELKKYLG